MRKPVRLAVSVGVVGGVALLVWMLFRGGGGSPSGGRAALRVDKNGISSAGTSFKSVADAVAAVRKSGASVVDVVVTGDAMYGTVNQLVAELKKAGLIVNAKGS